jgi:glycosyltransferase involved in cell wall biosynthesis
MMRIAMIAPLVESVPPPLYGGTERVVSVLTDELARRGHDVTLFASADSVTLATLVPMAPLGLRLDPAVPDSVASYQFHHMMMLGEVYCRAGDFDVIHSHVDPLAFPFARLSAIPTVSTLHGRLDLPEIQRVLRRYPEQALVSISDGQRRGVENLLWVGTVHNGVAVEHFTFQPEIGGYLVFLGRITPEKRPDRAIEIARDAGMPLVIAAKVDPVDIDYYKGFIKPMIASSSLVEYIGEVTEAEKNALLGGAYALIFPIDWPEPFGLAMIEAMATGTPVVTYDAGSVREIVIDGETGYIRGRVSDMVTSLQSVPSLDRAACRARVEQFFSATAMADGYESIYRNVAGIPEELPRDLLLTGTFEDAMAAR